MLWIRIRVEQAHRDRLRLLPPEYADGALHVGDHQGTDDVALGIHSFSDLQPQGPRDKWRGATVPEIIHDVATHPGNLEDVPEAFGRDETCYRALPLEEGVQPNGGAVDEIPAACEVQARLFYGVGDAQAEVLRGSRNLGRPQLSRCFIYVDEVRERAPDVHGRP